MIRYHLDDLGWYQFESLIQSLLKAEVSVAVEAWGGHSDWGRDAYSASPLPFPNRKKETAGPFVFQMKFVEGANAKGAKPRKALLDAVETEAQRILDRKISGVWANPKWYVLLTNCPIHSSARAAIAEIIKPIVGDGEVISLGGKDVCNLLDAQPELRRSFPEILSLRDLDVLLEDVVNHSIIERSKSAIEEAREVVAAFVQTANYHKAYQILKKYGFVVLDGPPEMGKTAIARVLSLAQISLGWEALDCRTPDDLLLTYRSNRKQLFIVDDAFGRTEYEPTLGRLWEKDLSRVFHKIDSKHWLVWTTRKHILARAVKDMDLVGRGSSFPEPGELVVTAEDLSTEEKAKILYRHAKAAHLNRVFREVIRANAVDIVADNHFTPERIRRLVSERIPELILENESATFSAEDLKREVIEAIHNPTKRMRKSFRKLGVSHEWILIALLDCEPFPSVKDLRTRYQQHRSNVSEHVFSDALEDLIGTFVKLSALWEVEHVDWIHPSYRDLVIDELMIDYEKQAAFLGNASSVGFGLALSEAGGAAGKRVLPFLGTDKSWDALETRALELVNGRNHRDIERVLRLLSSAFYSEEIKASSRKRARDILHKSLLAANVVYEKSDGDFSVGLIRVLLSSRRQFGRKVPVPKLEIMWNNSTERLRETLDDTRFVISQYAVDQWSKLARVIEMYAPRFFEDETRMREYNEDRQRLEAAIEAELETMVPPDEKDERDDTVSRLRSLAGSFEELNYDNVIGNSNIANLTLRLEDRADTYEEQDYINDDRYDGDFDEPIKSDAFNIQEFFADL